MEQFNNYAVITLAAACGSGDATITVTNPTALSVSGTYALVCENEIMTATARTGAVVSVLRGQEGTTAAAHAIGKNVTPNVTARALRQAVADAAPPSWITVLDLDFTSLATQALATDGNYTLGGRVWKKYNSNNEFATATITNGVGVTFRPYGSIPPVGSFAMPFLWLPIASLFGSVPVDWGTQMRIFSSIGADNVASTTTVGSVVGVSNVIPGTDGDVTVGPGTACWLLPDGIFAMRGCSSGGLGTLISWSLNSGNYAHDVDGTYTLGAGSKTICLETQALAYFSTFAKHYYGPALAPAAPFPPLATMHPDLMGTLSALAGGSATFGSATSLPADMGLVIGAANNHPGGNYTTVHQRIRVDVRN